MKTLTSEDIYKRFQVGDHLLFKLKDRTVEGSLMPSHAFTSDGVVVLKLSAGYNIGLHEKEIVDVELLGKRTVRKDTIQLEDENLKAERCLKTDSFKKEEKPRVTILTMGGTIASKVEYSTGAVRSVLRAQELIKLNPDISKMASIQCVTVCNVLSENITPHHMADAARTIADEINKGVDGIVVTHGTDTMGYTSAMMSFMLPALPVPVVFVGSQRSSDRPSSDATKNLYDAIAVATAGRPGVMVVMHGESSDSFALIHRGTKVRKFHSSRRDAFQSVNVEPLGKVENGKVEWFSSSDDFFSLQGKMGENQSYYKPLPNWNEKVLLLYIHPGLRKEIFTSVFERCEGVVFAGTGLGHISLEFIPLVEEFIKKGGVAVMTTQCFNGTVNMNVYTNGRRLVKAGVISGRDMLPETALMKLMWALGQTKDKEEVKRLMLENLRGEFTERRRF